MNKIYKLVALVAIIFTLGSSTANAQANFIVEWNGCDVQVTGSEYFVTYLIYDNTTGQVVCPATPYGGVSHTLSWTPVTIYDWDCNEGDLVAHYYLFVQVDLKDGNGPYCSGTARSSLLTCDDLHNYKTTITVNMSY
jgi:hypothetical protein